MPSVVLTGFSTVGKSTLGKRLEDEFGTQITLLDSDVYVAEKHHGHIYNIFYEIDGRVEYASRYELHFGSSR